MADDKLELTPKSKRGSSVVIDDPIELIPQSVLIGGVLEDDPEAGRSSAASDDQEAGPKRRRSSAASRDKQLEVQSFNSVPAPRPDSPALSTTPRGEPQHPHHQVENKHDDRADHDDDTDHDDDGKGEGTDVLKDFPISKGLSTQEAEELLSKYGRNELPEKITPKWLIFCRLLWQPMPVMIWIAAIVEIIIENYEDMAILIAINLINARCVTL